MLSIISYLGVLISFLTIFILSKRGFGLNKQMIVAAIFGIAIGYLLNTISATQGLEVTKEIALFKFIYSLYINLLLFIVAPLIFVSVINSVIKIDDFEILKRIGFKVLVVFSGTAFIASIIGLVVSLFMRKSFLPVYELSQRTLNTDTFSNYLLKLFPQNFIADFGSNKIIAIVLAAILFGCAILYLGNKVTTLRNLVSELNSVMFTIIGIFIKLSPYSIVAIIAYVAMAFGWEKLIGLLPFAIAVYLAMIIHFVFVFGGLVQFVAKLNFIKFLKKAYPATFFAFNSASSAATLPVTITSVKNMGVSDRLANFIPPLGATMNMNACGAIFPTIVAIFTAQVFSIPLDFFSYSIIVLMSVLASLGTAGVPGAAVVTTTVVLSSVGLPLEGLLMVLTIDRVIDMGRTSVNVTGDLVASVVLAANENELDKDVFNN